MLAGCFSNPVPQGCMLPFEGHRRLVNLCAVSRITALRSPKCGVTHVRMFFWGLTQQLQGSRELGKAALDRSALAL